MGNEASPFSLVSVVIPAHNTELNIGDLVRSVTFQCAEGTELEVIVVNDGSTDRTAMNAEEAGATVLNLPTRALGGNPAMARNRGAAASRGDPIIFLDSDCIPRDGWLEALLRRQATGVAAVGGSLALPKGLPTTARCDYYCGWYHYHSRRLAGFVRQHPPANLCVRRMAFIRTSGFSERHPVAYAHEELRWQAELQAMGGKIYFEPKAAVDHYNRPGYSNLLCRNYRWGYSAIESKAASGITRSAWIYKYPRFLILSSLPLAVVTTAYVIGCWLRARVLEPLWMAPAVLAARMAYSIGMMVGGLRWLSEKQIPTVERRPRWE